MPEMPAEGAAAPKFTLPDQDGDDFSPADAKGEWLVLYFYPRADTPGCTTQACSVRDRSGEYADLDARVVGVSPDTVEDVKKFHDKFDLDFTLLADPDHAVAEKLGTWGEKSMYGNTYMGVLRSTYLIDPDGKVARTFPKIAPKKHDPAVLKALAELTAGS